MDTNAGLKHNIKEWVRLEQEIQQAKAKMKSITAEKAKITQDILTSMKSGDIKCVELNVGNIVYKTVNVKRPFSKKQLTETLTTYFQNDANSKEIIDTILGSRPVESKETITLKPKKT
jgi:hypothetical protein